MLFGSRKILRNEEKTHENIILYMKFLNKINYYMKINKLFYAYILYINKKKSILNKINILL